MKAQIGPVADVGKVHHCSSKKKMSLSALQDAGLAHDSGHKKLSFWRRMKDYIWMWWDGLIFFGYDDTKLPRLNGAKTSFTDKFRNKKWLMITFTSVMVILYVLTSQISKLGTVKSQKMELTMLEDFHYNATEALQMIGVSYFYVSQLIPRVRKH